MLTRLALPLALCLAAMAAPSHGAPLPAPTVSYSADRIIETEAGTITGKVYAARGMERQESTMSGMSTILILRHDKQVGYMLMPAQHMYQQLDFAQAKKQAGAQAADQVDITEVGHETIEGLPTTKYKAVMKDGSGGGFMWITSDGIAIKMDMLSKSERAKTRMTLTLKNVQIGAQDPQLFEVPADYKALPKFSGVAGLGAFGAGRAAGASSSAAPNASDATHANGAADTADTGGASSRQTEQPSVAGAAAKSGISALGSAARGLFHRH
ncbi:MAG TPA: DUF4412 domain-containing protein [Steroidobacteraceae bacterium]|nr:DUF4412 domain-containing protein [Steroidobacteraceae bacterium]